MSQRPDVDRAMREEPPACRATKSVITNGARVDVARPGVLLGHVHRPGRKGHGAAIYGAGNVSVGDQTVVLGVSPGASGFYVLRLGKLAVWPKSWGHQLSVGLEDPRTVDDVGAWANRAADRFLEFALTRADRDSIRHLELGYEALVAALVDRTVVDLAASHPSMRATWEHIARGCHPDWTRSDLFRPRPSMRHALIVSLACSAPATTAGTLIARGAMLELRVPLLDEGDGSRMYTRAAQVLAKGCPAWWQVGAATDWRKVGTSVSAVLGEAFWAGVNNAQTRDRTLLEALGHERDALRLGHSGS